MSGTSSVVFKVTSVASGPFDAQPLTWIPLSSTDTAVIRDDTIRFPRDYGLWSEVWVRISP